LPPPLPEAMQHAGSAATPGAASQRGPASRPGKLLFAAAAAAALTAATHSTARAWISGQPASHAQLQAQLPAACQLRGTSPALEGSGTTSTVAGAAVLAAATAAMGSAMAARRLHRARGEAVVVRVVTEAEAGGTTETVEAAETKVVAPAPKAKAKAKAQPKASPAKPLEPMLDQITTGIFAGAVFAGYAVLGERLVDRLRGKGIGLHAEVINSFCQRFAIPSRTRQGFIKTAKKTGHDLGFLIPGGYFGDGMVGPGGMEWYKNSGIEKWSAVN